MIYALTTCSLGPLLAAWTEWGLSYVGFGMAEQLLLADLKSRQRLPAAASAAHPPDLEQLVLALEDRRFRYSGSLDLRGTPFQKRVWDEITDIPYGYRTTYEELAKAVGRPGAMRAVAQACSQNPLAIVIPCHRVVAKYKLGGYRWGITIKERLLAMEQPLTIDN